MRLADVLRPECVKVKANFEDKAFALCEIASLARRSPICKKVSEEAILEALQERETLGSTAIGEGIAIPHCRLKGIKDFVVGFITVPNGVDFESPDGLKTRLLMFIIAPADRPTTHIRLLSSLSRALQEPQAVTKLLNARDSESAISFLVQLTGPDIRTDRSNPKSQLHVFVQDEPVFKEILSTISGLETSSLAVMDAENSRHYLSALPLYAAMGKNGRSDVCKVIVAIVEQKLSNEIIRRIETVTGPLQECSGVMVTVQDLAYSAGSLEP